MGEMTQAQREFAAYLAEQITVVQGKSGGAMVDALQKLSERIEQRFAVPMASVLQKTPGQIYIESAAYKEAVSSKAKTSGPVPISVPGYDLGAGERIEPRLYAAKTGEVVASDFVSRRTYGPLVDIPRQAAVRDLMPVVGLGTPQLEYPRITGISSSAAGVAEKGAKPASTITAEAVLEGAKKIATYIPVTREAFEDNAFLRNWIDTVMGYFLQLEENDQLLNGTGGNDLTGILQTGGVQTQGFSVNIIETVRKAITLLELEEFAATGIVMHPSNWESAELTKDLDDRYILIPSSATPASGSPPTLWRVPVVRSKAIPLNTGLIGNFAIGATLWVYKDVSVKMTDSHSDWFVYNILAIVAEMRELLSVYFPKAFVNMTLA